MATKKTSKAVKEEVELKEVELQNESEDKMEDILNMETASMKEGE